MTKNHIGQFFNLDGILFNLKYIFKLHKVKPDVHVKSIIDLDLNSMKNTHGIKHIVFDKDNTLTLPHLNYLANEMIANKIDEFKKVFGNDNLAILSNSAGSKDDKQYKEAIEIEMKLGLKVIRHQYKKPRVFKEIIETFDIPAEFVKINYENRKEICVIGDRLLVDVIMGKEFGFYTVLVDPITKEKDNFIVRILRRFENFLIQ